MGNTKLISMRIDAELHKKARELGLNITKVCENALKEAVAKLEAPNTQTNGGTPSSSRQKKLIAGPRGLIPKRVQVLFSNYELEFAYEHSHCPLGYK